MRTQLLDIPRAAEQLRVAQKTLYKWVEAGQVPFVRIGRLVRFRPEDLERWVAGRVCDSIAAEPRSANDRQP